MRRWSRLPRRLLLAVAVGLVILGPNPWGGALAQKLNFGSGDSDQPIEIFADNGIEWQQENLIFLARGNAFAVRDAVSGWLGRAFGFV